MSDEAPVVAPALTEMSAVRCAHHPLTGAVSCCSTCGAFLCRSCDAAGQDGFEVYCSSCSAGHAVPAPRELAAPFFSRFMAVVLDFIVLDTGRTLLHLFFGWELILVDASGRLVGQAWLLSILLWFLYCWIGWARYGTTLGKALLGLRVVRAGDHGPLTWGGALVRCLGCFLCNFPCFIGFWAILWDPGQRAWYDRLAGTEVIRTLRE